VALDGQLIFEGKVDQFKSQAGHAGFMRDYVRALKCVAPDMANDLNTTVLTIGDPGDPLNYPDYAQGTLEAGLDYWLVRFGNKTGTLDMATALALYKEARTELRTYVDIATQRSLPNGAGQIGLTS